MNHVLSWALKLSGAVLIVFGLQAWGFYGFVFPQIDNADKNLMALLEEAPSNSLIDETMGMLRDYRRANDDGVTNRQILELRQMIAREYRDNPGAVIDEAIAISGGFNGNSEIERELLESLRRNLLRLHAIYSDQYGEIISRYYSPPFYLQPTAALLALNQSTRDRLEFNRALYLMLTGNHKAANAMYSELGNRTGDDVTHSRILYAQARLQFAAFRIDGNPEYYRQAVTYTQESLSADPFQGLPKLFLEYLLSIEQQAMNVESTPEEGQGSGEAQGERGSISNDSAEH